MNDIFYIQLLFTDYNDDSVSWAGWAWSLVPSILPNSEDDWNKDQFNISGHTFQFGFYVDNASLTFKVCIMYWFLMY